MSIHGNWHRRHEGFRPNYCHGGYENRRYFMDYEQNSLFNNPYCRNYGYQPYPPRHNNFFGKLLGFGAVAALGYGIGKSGGIAPFFKKVGNFFSNLFGRREDLSNLKRLDPIPLTRIEIKLPQRDIASELQNRINRR